MGLSHGWINRKKNIWGDNPYEEAVHMTNMCKKKIKYKAYQTQMMLPWCSRFVSIGDFLMTYYDRKCMRIRAMSTNKHFPLGVNQIIALGHKRLLKYFRNTFNRYYELAQQEPTADNDSEKQEKWNTEFEKLCEETMATVYRSMVLWTRKVTPLTYKRKYIHTDATYDTKQHTNSVPVKKQKV